jgi:DNA-binding MarR family transcriptional regulator
VGEGRIVTAGEAAGAEARNLGWELSTAVVLFHEAIARRMGLSAADHKALGVIRRAGELTAGELAGETGLSPAAVTGLLDRLEDAGYVRRRRDARDRRRILVSSAPDERSNPDGIFAELTSAMEGVVARYNEDEVKAIRDYLVRTIAVLRAQTRTLAR